MRRYRVVGSNIEQPHGMQFFVHSSAPSLCVTMRVRYNYVLGRGSDSNTYCHVLKENHFSDRADTPYQVDVRVVRDTDGDLQMTLK